MNCIFQKKEKKHSSKYAKKMPNFGQKNLKTELNDQSWNALLM